MDEQTKRLFDIVNHPDFVFPPAYSPKTLRLCGLLLKDAEESIQYWEAQGCLNRSELGPKESSSEA
jgi:hypothetical protein